MYSLVLLALAAVASGNHQYFRHHQQQVPFPYVQAYSPISQTPYFVNPNLKLEPFKRYVQAQPTIRIIPVYINPETQQPFVKPQEEFIYQGQTQYNQQAESFYPTYPTPAPQYFGLKPAYKQPTYFRGVHQAQGKEDLYPTYPTPNNVVQQVNYAQQEQQLYPTLSAFSAAAEQKQVVPGPYQQVFEMPINVDKAVSGKDTSLVYTRTDDVVDKKFKAHRPYPTYPRPSDFSNYEEALRGRTSLEYPQYRNFPIPINKQSQFNSHIFQVSPYQPYGQAGVVSQHPLSSGRRLFPTYPVPYDN